MIIELLIAVFVAWVAIGMWMTGSTASRGWKADLLFVFAWPINWYLDTRRD